MRVWIFLTVLFLSSTVYATTYYVAPSGGNDSNAGTNINAPWATPIKAFATAKAGDTVYFRGGTYLLPNMSRDYVMEIKNSGTADNPICFFDYPGDKDPVVFDCRNNNSGSKYNDGLLTYSTNYINMRGFTIANVRQFAVGVECTGMTLYDVTNYHIERVKVWKIGGPGIKFYSDGVNDSSSFVNCDAYYCYDSLATSGFLIGGKGDGFWAQMLDGGHLTFEGCRAYKCSDDGFNFPCDGIVDINNCWAIACGKGDGDGNGFKLDVTGYGEPDKPMLRTVTKCLSAFNTQTGFTWNNQIIYPHGQIINCTSYDNWIGYMSFASAYAGNINEYYYNNVGYKNYDSESGIFREANIPHKPTGMSNNTFTWGSLYPFFSDIIALTDADFVSVDSTGIAGPRQADGSLPDINFLKPVPGGKLIDAGKDMGLPYYGSAPDIGYSEYVSGSVSPSAPLYLTSLIENATPSRLEMTYNMTLANIVPATSAFAVKVNNIARTISSVSISGTKVYLTLASPVVYGDAVTVAYTKPATNPLQTPAGGQAASITAKNVTNNLAAPVPVYVNSVIENATPSRLEMNYSLALATITPATSAFTVKVNTTTRTVASVSISGTKVYLTLSSPVVYGDVVTVAYTKPSTNPLQTTNGGQAVTIGAQTVINNCSEVINQPPVVNISSPTKNTAFIAPATITIDATASDPDGSIVKVEFYNGQTKLGESATIPYSFTWKEVPEGSYIITAVAIDNLNSRAVSASVTVIVEKAAQAVNQLPVVTIKNPNRVKKFKKNETITLEAQASDPDGTISKVEFKSGNVILAEITVAPYIYLWQNPDTGTYIITAVATDNLGAVSQSPEVELSVVEMEIPGFGITNLYPNPSNGNFSIDMSGVAENERRFTIYSLAGQALYSEERPGEEITVEFNFPEMPSGTYVLAVSSGRRIIDSRKFIKR